MTETSTSTGYATLGSKTAPYIAVTVEAIACSDPILYEDFADCNVPGGRALWRDGGFFSPGVCFVGYSAGCTETTKGYQEGFPIRHGETAVKCVPSGYSCNTETEDQRYATSQYGAQILSAPAFEIRWRQEDLGADSSEASTSDNMSTEPIPGGDILTTPETKTAHGRSTTTVQVMLSTIVETPSQPTETRPDTGHKKPVSSGSIAGIAVGSACAILAMALGVIFFILRRRRSREDRLARFSDDFRSQGYPEVGLAAAGGQTAMELDSSPVEPKELAADTELVAARRSFPHPFRHRAKHTSVNGGQPVELPA